MSTTPAKPRQSGIPAPGKSTGIPTPGRVRSTSSASQHSAIPTPDPDAMRAFNEAVKANDPAHHRNGRASDATGASLSPKANGSLALSGRRSVTGRPPSVASTSSAAGSTPAATRFSASRTKTPTARPPSRQSDTFFRSSSRLDKSFEVGDNVRIESLGFEGTLRYLGEIDGKAGQWAGVELSGGFLGMGKNDGSVNGKHYFRCPPKCGVFVATAKLSPPTTGIGSISRPSSVASSRGGRVTPSVSGRVTPSIFGTAGRFTPHSSTSGRITPAMSTSRVPSRTVTPSARTRTKTGPPAGTFSADLANGNALMVKLREAREQESRRQSGGSPTRNGSVLSPSSITTLSTPSSPSVRTPKPGLGTRTAGVGVGLPSTTPTKSRPSLLTPRGRIPSAIAMPPPPSPLSPGLKRTVSMTDYSDLADNDLLGPSDLLSNGKAIEGRIASLLSGRSSAGATTPSPAPPSPAFNDSESSGAYKAKLDTLEVERQRLRSLLDSRDNEELEARRRSEMLREDKDRALARVAELEASMRAAERTLHEREAKIEAMERTVGNAAADTDKVRGEGEARVRDLQSRLDDKEELLKNLKEAIALKEGVVSENTAVLNAKDAEISVLEARVKKSYKELEDERRELGGQVDALRQAGQETIALYEERLAAAEDQRYEQEALVTNLQERLNAAALSPSSPTPAAPYTATAIQIENESLREQISHLQQQVVRLEDMLENSRITADKEVAMLMEKLKRHKEREETLKKQLIQADKDKEQMAKSEASLRGRLEEVDEALRESTVALDLARVDIETMQNDGNLESMYTNSASSDSSERLAEMAQRLSSERARAAEEIAQLKRVVEELRHAQTNGTTADEHRSETYDASLQEVVEELTSEKAALETTHRDLEVRLRDEQNLVIELRERLDRSHAELESTRKKANRETPLPNGASEMKRTPSSSSSRHESSAVREELAGLKHIIQELQKENTAAAQQYKLLEAENKLLLAETEQLREDMKSLEDSVDNSILREEQSLNESSPSLDADGAQLQRAMKDMRLRHEVELEQLRKKQHEVENKSARTIHDLNKEVSELESLIESKIYREDELEQEVERLKDKLSRAQKKTSKNAVDIAASGSSSSLHSMSDDGQGSGDVCEICEQPGHDIFSCHLLKGDSDAGVSTSSKAYCDDCESYGHLSADCPHSMDVF
ncbi:hypothetical protein FA95DRAFT_243872 [Auriscalpium vulgare]|uniref:Uncharacterized protein n=1 Tax=Auriscalpium vulgare TaxID=40419 RepID=A0ACB8S6U6_9AGAM|nr:hypothetical protein FA95DRAFT_243872 [Auriscalpium vulgare]